MNDKNASQTTQIKLLVGTAAEAVSILRERYGDKARVLSVRQVEAEGLKRLISKPRLEVIVEVVGLDPEAAQLKPPAAASPSAPAQAAAPAPEAKPKPSPAKSAEPKTTSAAPAAGPKSPISNIYARKATEPAPEAAAAPSSYFAAFDEPARPAKPAAPAESATAADQDAPLGTAANPVRSGTLEAVSRAIAMLEAVGFDRSLIERARAEIDFRDIGSLPTMELYARICDWLRRRFPAQAARPLASSRAFIGVCGAGKTAALCKMLSGDVFTRELSPTVLKIDSELPNPSDALEIFCEIMGASLARSRDEVEAIDAAHPLLVDMPGYLLRDPDSIAACGAELDELGIEERILVINAAYDAEAIGDQLAAGERIGATRVVFTHLDEARRVGKLWKFLLNGRITPLFFSEGPNPAGDCVADTYSFLLERTFPNGRELAASARSASTRQRGRGMREESLSS